MLTEEPKKGFYTALGTPLDSKGKLMIESFKKQINMQIDSGASGLLAMGSMGAMASITTEEYAKVAQVAAETVSGRVPLFIGAMDNSVWRVLDRLKALEGLLINGVVLTTPFYQVSSPENLVLFFTQIADKSSFPIYLYDLPIVTKQKITYNMVSTIVDHPNIAGIKTGDVVLVRKLLRDFPDFITIFSNLDIFDMATAFGTPRVLDGMFACTPKNAAKFSNCFLAEDFLGAGEYLEKIIELRDIMAKNGIWPGFTIAMNLIGCEGIYGYGYDNTPLEGEAQAIKEKLVEIGEL